MSAEKSLLGCLILGSNDTEICTSVSAKDFTDSACRDLFCVLHEYWQRFGAVDAGCVPAQHRALATECADFLPTLSNWRAYIAATKDDAAKYRAKNLALSIAMGGMDLPEIRQAAGELVSATQGNDRVRRMGMRDALKVFRDEQESKPEYLKTGIARLDEKAYIEKGDFVVIGARPSTGKTAFALQLALNFAKQGMKTVFYSYETTIEKLIGRTAASQGRVPLSRIKRRDMAWHEGFAGLDEGLGDLPLEFVESAGKDVGWIKADVIRGKTQVVVIDYIGQIPAKGSSRYEQVTNTSLAIRELCQTTGVIAFVLCQINRQGHSAPTMEDLKESGQIEQDADAVILLHNKLDVRERDGDSPVDLIIAKNKEGVVGKILTTFVGEFQEFREVETRYG